MVTKIIKTNKTDVEKDIRNCLKEIGYIPKKKKVLIKPNVVGAYKPDSPCITNPRVVSGIIDYLHEQGIKDIVVGEAPVNTDFSKVMEVSGYSELCKEKNVKLLNLYEAPRKKHNFFNRHIMLPAVLDEYEYINVAKLKTHTQTTVSLCIKNQKGLLNFDDRRAFHKNLHKDIAELYRAVKPDLSVIDALNGLEGNGPGSFGKEVKNLNLLILGDDAWEVDSVATMLMGIDPSTVKHLMLVNKNTGKVKGYYEDIQGYKRSFKLPSREFRLFNITYEWAENTCSGCSSKMRLLKQKALRSPRLLLRLAYYAFLGKLYILTGSPKEKKREGKIICVGDCCKEFALEYDLKLVKGCPPKTEDFLKEI